MTIQVLPSAPRVHNRIALTHISRSDHKMRYHRRGLQIFRVMQYKINSAGIFLQEKSDGGQCKSNIRKSDICWKHMVWVISPLCAVLYWHIKVLWNIAQQFVAGRVRYNRRYIIYSVYYKLNTSTVLRFVRGESLSTSVHRDSYCSVPMLTSSSPLRCVLTDLIPTLPLSWEGHQTTTRFDDAKTYERLGEDVHKIWGGRLVIEFDSLLPNMVSQKMHIYVNMLCPGVEFGIMGDGNCGLVVWLDDLWGFDR
jgi:hypothetical protein